MKLKTGDIFIIAVVILSALCIILGKKEQGGFAVLEADGEVIEVFDLKIDTKYIYTGDYQNVIMVKDGEVFVSSSTCPDKTCVKTHAASQANTIICCLPNKLMIRVVKDKPEVDVISG